MKIYFEAQIQQPAPSTRAKSPKTLDTLYIMDIEIKRKSPAEAGLSCFSLTAIIPIRKSRLKSFPLETLPQKYGGWGVSYS